MQRFSVTLNNAGYRNLAEGGFTLVGGQFSSIIDLIIQEDK